MLCEQSKNMVKTIYQKGIECIAYFLLSIKISHVNENSTRAHSNKFDLFKNRKKDSTPDRPSKNEDLCCFEKQKKPKKTPKSLNFACGRSLS